MKTRFADFDVAQAIRDLQPARVFLRRRDPALRACLKAMLPEDACSFCEIADSALLLREVSTQLLAWQPGELVEVTMADRAASPDGARDIVIGFRRPAWNAGIVLLTALHRAPDGNEEEYGSALVLGPGVAIALGRPTHHDAAAPALPRNYKLAS
jgi:hypothetical protein